MENHTKFCKMAFLNPWSLNNKFTAVYDFIEENDLDLLAVAESWVKGKENNKSQRIYRHEMFPVTHEMVYTPRPGERKGGGIAIIYKKSFKLNIVEFSKKDTDQFEFLVVTVEYGRTRFRLAVTYRPNPTSANHLNLTAFWKYFERFLIKHICCSDEFILTGDLNFHLDLIENPNTTRFNCLLDEFGLHQIVNGPTHVAGHTLDILVARTGSSFITSFHIADPCLHNDNGKEIRDHFAIHWSVRVEKPKPVIKTIEYRELNKINISLFLADVSKTDLVNITINDERSAEELVELYNSTLESLINVHAPLKTRKVIERQSTPWYNETVTAAKRKRRQAERSWRQSGLIEQYEQYRKQCSATNRVLRLAKLSFFSDQITNCGRDQKAIFNLTKRWMGTSVSNESNKSENDQKTANNFASFFTDKVNRIHQQLLESLDTQNPYVPILSDNDPAPCTLLQNFRPATPTEIEDIVSSSAAKHCGLDPLPTSVLKKIIHLISPFITLIINKSFISGIVPHGMKTALVRPQLKNPSLDLDALSNYRPVSNLSFLSKILEKTVNSRLDKHLENNHLLSNHQSAYRKHHSTETTLVKVQNDILTALDSGYATILLLLDVSAAFDVVSHERLLGRQKEYFGITGSALNWMASYLRGRTQCVVIGFAKSYTVDVKYGFPQGSVLGGKKFIMYATPLGNIIVQHDVEHECYADDTQKYISFKLQDPGALASALEQMKQTLNVVQSWMTANILKLNSDKTEMIIFAPKRHQHLLENARIHIDDGTEEGAEIIPEVAVKNLGVMFDSTMSYDTANKFNNKILLLSVKEN